MVGQTKDAGWQIGVSKTVPHPVARVWDFIASPEGTAVWLGPDAELKPEKGFRYETATGVAGEVRSFHEHDRIRLTWRPADWDHDSTVQVAVTANGDRTVLRFHQEWLADAEERERQRAYWKGVMNTVVDALGS
ncbi:Uncharacterized conserved protein YndB, AHSA1/START domain [Actinokineospora alba]|uniref:Uncharacterized conserved protein YndB, AHSA1/START domain n=1 Tax=Actinokineospora alba TaxID=504798 RepID=A0A1H0PPQ3_9PSEU|nr:SRPBCC domain-containing protein [Actinokineospora alba]TDP65894.1 uncharacterized protein YndB with AHSA1/START domain [Actinokineospora alba]SDI62735.1 Uncharacterized conserved protein YndB, AHSA1/START domain [Actinokineospora alba]SDP07092.1 Uncharacterized conserved protein YndB, AHSA1/START domain [Actinokineospora alba]